MMDPEVLKVFMEETKEILEGLTKAIAGQNLEPIYRLAHTLKGNAAQFGFPEVSSASKEIEVLAKEIQAGEKKLDADNVGLFNKMLDRLRELCQAIKS